MKNMKAILALGLAGAMMFGFAACGAPKEEEKQDVSAIAYDPSEQLGEGKVLVVGTSADYAPYEFRQLINGKDMFVGFDIGLAKEIAKDLGMQLKIEDKSFESLITEMNLGKIDIVIAGLSADPERDADFSKNYYAADQSCVIRKADKDVFTDISAFDGKSVGAQTGSIQEGLVNSEFTKSTPVSLAKIPDLVLSLKTNKIDGVIMEKPVALGYTSVHDDMYIAFDVPYEVKGSSVAVKKGNTELLDAINKTIDRVTADGTMDKYIDLATVAASDILTQ